MIETSSNSYVPAAPHRHLGTGDQSTGRSLMARRRLRQRILAGGMLALLAAVIASLTALPGARSVWAHKNETHLPVVMSEQPPQPLQALPQEQSQPEQPLPTEPVRILLLGSDQRGDDRSFRTDVIVLVTVDAANGTASAVSFPRDLWVEPPTLYPMKINMVQALGGFDAMAAMFESNFGVRPDYYVLTNFSGFSSMIDTIGGIDVHVHEPLKDSCDLPQAPGGVCDLQPGVQVMDGATALWYVRSRATTSDFDRLRRAQEVVQAVFERLMNMNVLLALPQAYNDLTQNVETNLGLGEITPLAPAGARIFREPDRIQRYAITEEQAYPSWSWDGMWILMPDMEKINAVLDEAGAK